MSEICEEKTLVPVAGWNALGMALGGLCFSILGIVVVATAQLPVLLLLILPFALACFVSLFGCMAIQPNDARVLLLFGEYRGTVSKSGFYWVNPFYSKKRISLRIRNFETGSSAVNEKKNEAGQVVQQKSRTHSKPSKVNDRDGNPIEISAVVVWKVVNTAEAMFEVDDYEDFVSVQSEAALRNLASRHPYDSEDHETSLRGSIQEISDQLCHDIQSRLEKAGVQVIEARISHLAYAPEIAAAMLQRQQTFQSIRARKMLPQLWRPR